MTRRTVPPLCASPIGRSLKKRSAKSLGLKSFAELTTPSAALRTLRAFLLVPQPPLLFEEGNVSALKQSANSFTRSEASMKSRANRVRLALVTTVISIIAIAGIDARGQSDPYHLVENWAKLPEGRKFGAVIGVGVDRGGNVWAFDRCGGDTCAGSKMAPILKFDSSGRLVNSFGAGMFIFPHGFSVDKDGNVWATDGQGKDGKGQQVFKFSPEGKVLLALGKAGADGAGEDTFNRPSAVVVAHNGTILIADGHGRDPKARIVKFSTVRRL